MATHHIPASPDTIRWGIFDAAFPPLLTVQSGDTVVLECLSGTPEMLPPVSKGFTIPPALLAIHQAQPTAHGRAHPHRPRRHRRR